MSDISKHPLENDPALAEKLKNASPEAMKQILADALVASGHATRDAFDPNVLLSTETGSATAAPSKQIIVNGVQHVITSDDGTEAGLLRAETEFFRKTFAQPAESRTTPARDERGRYDAAPTPTEQAAAEEEAFRQSELRLKLTRGELSVDEYVLQSGVVDKYTARAFEKSWEQSTADALASPEFANWRGGQDSLERIGRTIQENGWEDAADKTEALKAAWLQMQQEDYETEINAKLKNASPDEIRDAIGYGRSSLFGR